MGEGETEAAPATTNPKRSAQRTFLPVNTALKRDSRGWAGDELGLAGTDRCATRLRRPETRECADTA